METSELEICHWIERYSGKYEYDHPTEDETEVMFARYFFVDYENVNRDGLNGVTKLSREDCVRIYYSEAAATLTFGLHRRINASTAHFDYIKVQMPIKNAVDCQILFDIRDITKKNRSAEYYIVSRDHDFDKAIDMFHTYNLKVRKVLEICKKDEAEKTDKDHETAATGSGKRQTAKVMTQKTESEKREAQVRCFFGRHFKKEIYREKKEEIIQAVLTGKTKQQVNNNLMKIFKNETVGEIYKKLQPLMADMPGK